MSEAAKKLFFFPPLTPAMRAALADLKTGALRKQRHGWALLGYRGGRGHATRTIAALHARGLCFVDVLYGPFGKGVATISSKGRMA